MPSRPFQNARVVITGASSGIGRELAGQLAACGARLLITARREERLQDLAAAIQESSRSQGCDVIAGDICDPSVRQQIAAHCDAWGGLDLLINNAGFGAIGRFADSEPERLRRVMEVNFFAPVELTRVLLPSLQRGTAPAVAIVGSVLGLAGVPLKSEYCASKFALHGWAEALRSELAPEGIDVLEMHPSTTESEFFEHVLGDATQQRSIGAMTPAQAAKKIAAAIRRRRKQTVFPWTGKAFVSLRAWLPPVFRRLVRTKRPK